jgi:transposase-like protein
MGTKKTSKPYPAELRERAVRLVREQEAEHASPAAAIRSIAEKVGCNAETLRLWVRQAERDQGQRAGLTTDERERLKALEREVRELRQANETCARRALILPRRSSTADPSHDRVHRRSPGRLRGRADLQGAADRPVVLPRPCRPAF